MIEPYCSNFRIITAIFQASEYLGVLQYIFCVSFQNRLHESLKLFRGICNNRFFVKSCMVSAVYLSVLFNQMRLLVCIDELKSAVMFPIDAEGVANTVDLVLTALSRSALFAF